MADSFKPCSVENCNGNAHYKANGATGMCRAHYKKNKKYGSPETPIRVSRVMAWINDHVSHVDDACLIWPFSRNKQGYGYARKGVKTMLAHKVMCIAANGNSPQPALEVAHSCGNGHLGCVNPKHLRWDTRAGNFADKVVHGTDNSGEKSPVAKLSQRDVDEIRALRGMVTQREIAARFGIDQSNVCKIQRRASWSYA